MYALLEVFRTCVRNYLLSRDCLYGL